MSLTTYGFGGAGAISVMGWGLGARNTLSKSVPKPKIVSSKEMVPEIVSEPTHLLPEIIEGTEDC